MIFKKSKNCSDAAKLVNVKSFNRFKNQLNTKNKLFIMKNEFKTFLIKSKSVSVKFLDLEINLKPELFKDVKKIF